MKDCVITFKLSEQNVIVESRTDIYWVHVFTGWGGLYFTSAPHNILPLSWNLLNYVNTNYSQPLCFSAKPQKNFHAKLIQEPRNGFLTFTSQQVTSTDR